MVQGKMKATNIVHWQVEEEEKEEGHFTRKLVKG